MPTLIDTTGKTVGDVPVPAGLDADFSSKRNAMFRAVHRELANPRAGTASTKRRDEVSGGGRKPWKQKGTGRARQGSTRSPQWRHGGVVFGPKPRSYVTSLNKKERRAALVAALADRFQGDRVMVLDAPSFEITKTKAFATALFGSPKAQKTGPSTLVVFSHLHDTELGEKIARVSGNLRNVAVTSSNALDVKDVLGYERLVLTRAAYDTLATALGTAE